MILLDIFLAFMRVSIIAFGGAYATIPLVEQEAVVNWGWMTMAEFSDLIALDEITPGPIMINSATFVGMHVAGIPGAIVATLGCIVIPCALVMILFLLYRHFRGSAVMESTMTSLKCMAIALIASTFVKLAMNALMPEGAAPDVFTAIYSIAIMAAAFYLINRKEIRPLPVMLGCGAVNLIAHVLIGF